MAQPRSAILGLQSVSQLADEKRTQTYKKRKKDVESAERDLGIQSRIEERESQFPEIYGQRPKAPEPGTFSEPAPKKKSALETFGDILSNEGQERMPTRTQAAQQRVDRAKIIMEEAGDKTFEPTSNAQIYQRHRTKVESLKKQLSQWNQKIEDRKKEGDLTLEQMKERGSPQAPMYWYEDRKKEIVDKLIAAEVDMMGAEEKLTAEDRYSISEEAKAIGEKIDYRTSLNKKYLGISEESPAGVQAGKDVLSGALGTAEGFLGALEWAGVDKAIPYTNKVQKWREELQPENPNFANTLFSGVGSAMTFFIPGLGVAKGTSLFANVSTRGALFFGGSASAFLEASAEAGSVYSEIADDTNSAYKASEAATKTFWVNAILVSLTNKFGAFSEAQKGMVRKALMSSSMEGIQEFSQQITSNVNTGKEWDEGVWEAGGVGAIIGGGMGAVADVAIPPQATQTEAQFQQVQVPDERTAPSEIALDDGSTIPVRNGYVYHSTTPQALEQIRENGLNPRDGQLFFTPSPEVSQAAAADQQNNSVMLRIPADLIQNARRDANMPQGVPSFTIDQGIPAQEIEVQQDGGYSPIAQRESVISAEEATKTIRKYFTESEVPVEVVNRIITPDGERALGQYRQGMVQFVQNPLQSTPQHEAVHAYMDLFAGREQRQEVLNQVKNENADDIASIMEEQGIDQDTAAEEYVADRFVEWVRAQETKSKAPTTLSQRVVNFFRNTWNQIKSFAGKGDKVEALYKDIVARKRTARNQSVREKAVFQRKKKGIPTYAAAQKQLQREGGFAAVDKATLPAKNSYAATELAQSLGLNPEFLYKNATENGIDLTEQLRKLDSMEDATERARFSTELMDIVTNTAIIPPRAEGAQAEEPDKEAFDIESVVRDGSPFITENVSTYDLTARQRFDIPKLKKISGGGSDRDVYDLGDYVLKVAKTARGLRQNDVAGDYLLEDANLIPMLRERGDNYIVVDKANPPDDATKSIVKKLNEFTMMDWENKSSALQEYFYSEPNGVDLSMALNYDILWNDLTARRNWGTKPDGTPVHVDEGTFAGRSLIDDYRGTKNLDDPEFRELYQRSRDAKKLFGDTDAATMYQRLPNDPELQPLKETLKNVTQELENIVSAAEAEIELLSPKTEEQERLEGLAEEVRRTITAPRLPGGLTRDQFFSQLAASADSIRALSDKLRAVRDATNSRDLATRLDKLINSFGSGTYDDLDFAPFQDAITNTLEKEGKGDLIDRAQAIIGERGDFEVDEGVTLSDLLDEIDRVQFAIDEKLSARQIRQKSRTKRNEPKTAKQSALETREGSLELPARTQKGKRKARSAEAVRDAQGNLRTPEGETLVKGRDLLRALGNLSKAKEQEFKVRLRKAVSEGKKARASGVRAQIQKKNAEREQIKRELIDEIRQRVPLEKRGKFLATVKNTRTRRQLEQALDRADREAAQFERKKIAGRIRKELKSTKVRKQGGKPVGKFTPEVQRTLDLLREAVNLKPEEAAEQIQKNIEKIDENKGVLDSDIALQNAVLDMVLGLEGKSPKQLQKLLDQIVALKNEGRMINELRKFNRQEEIDRQTNGVMDVLTGGKGLPEGVDTTGIKEIDPTTATEKAIQQLNKVGRSHYAYPDLLDDLSKLDKGSKAYQSNLSKFGDIHKIKNAEKKAQREFTQKARQMFLDAYGLKNDRQMITKMREDSREFSLGAFTNANGVDVDLRFTRQQLRKRWMELQDPSLEQSFREGMGYTDEMMFAIDEAMTEGDRNFAQAQLDLYKEMYQPANEVYELMYGVSLPNNDFYSPIRRRGFQAESAAGFGEFMNEISMRRSTAPGSVKSRVKNVLPIENRSDVSVLQSHFAQMQHFISWAEKMRDLRAVFDNPKVQAAIEVYHGKKNRFYLEHFLNDFTRGGFDMAQKIEGIDLWRSRFTRSALAIKPFITLKQLTSAPAFAENMPVGKFIQYSAEFWKSPRANARDLYEKSESLKERGKTMDKDIQNAMRTDEYKNFRKGQRAMDMIMINIQLGDQGAIIAGGWPYYQYLRKDLKLSEEEAIERFEKQFESSQQSGDIENLNFWQRNSSFSRMFTMFMSTPMQYMNKEIGALRNVAAGRMSKQQAAKTIFIYHFLLPMIFQLVSDLGRWNTKEQARAMVLGSFNGIFIAGEFLEILVRGVLNTLPGEDLYIFDANTPVLTVMDGFVKAINNLTEKEVDGTDIQDALDGMASTTGNLTGLPIQQGVRFLIGAKDIAKGDYAKGLLQAILGTSRYQAEQATGRKGSTSKKSSL